VTAKHVPAAPDGRKPNRATIDEVESSTPAGRAVAGYLAAVVNGDRADDGGARDAVIAIWLNILHQGEWRCPSSRGFRMLRQHAERLVAQIAAEPFEAWTFYVASSGDSIEYEIGDQLELEWIEAAVRA
jgi:hypothetical protein